MFNRVTGLWEKQKVHLGRLQNGQLGLFTGNTLVMHLKEEITNGELMALCDRCEFEFVAAPKGD